MRRRRHHGTSSFTRRWLPTVIFVSAASTAICGFCGFFWQYRDGLRSQEKSQPAPVAPEGAQPLAGPPQTVNSTPPAAGPDWSIPILKTVQLFLLNSGAEDDASHPSNWLLIVARLSAATLFLVVSGAVIARVLNDVRGLPGHLTRKHHVVICGLGQIGLQLLEDLKAKGRSHAVVVIENNPANPWLENARALGAVVIIGDSTKESTLREARAHHAKEVFVVTGDDGVNLEVTAELGVLLKEQKNRKRPLRLFVHIVDTNFATTLRPYCKVLHDTPNILVHVFNVPRTAAARLVTNQLWPHAPKNRNEVAHYVILGFGAMGQNLAIQLAQLGNFPNCKRSRFTIADRDIEQLGKTFLARFSRFTSWTDERSGVNTFSPETDAWSSNSHPLPSGIAAEHAEAIQYACNAEFIDLPAGRGDERFAALLAERFRQTNVKPVIFICGQQDRDNFETAVQLRERLACRSQSNVPIFVWLPRQPALAETLKRSPEGNFHPFGECRASASYTEITAPIRDSIGRRIHDDYEQRQVDDGKQTTKNPWSAIRDDYRESNRVAADHLNIKLATLGLRLLRARESLSPSKPIVTPPSEMLQLLAEMEHNRWVVERLLAGWRYAPKGQSEEELAANKKLKLNPSLVPWDKLDGEKDKDFNQITTVLRECQKDRFCVTDLSAVTDGDGTRGVDSRV